MPVLRRGGFTPATSASYFVDSIQHALIVEPVGQVGPSFVGPPFSGASSTSICVGWIWPLRTFCGLFARSLVMSFVASNGGSSNDGSFGHQLVTVLPCCCPTQPPNP